MYIIDANGDRQHQFDMPAGVTDVVYATEGMPIVLTDATGTCEELALAEAGLSVMR